MKTLKYFPVLILLTVASYSQNIIDPPILPIGFDSTALFDKTFNDTTFILGWNWSSTGRRLDEAMSINYHHQGYDLRWDNDSTFTDSTLYVRNHRKAVQVTGVSGGRNSNFILNAHSQILYPVIDVDPTSDFVPRAFDSTGSVFGFQNKNKVRILNSSQNAHKDYHFAMLDKDSIPTTPVVVLSNIWKNNILRFLNYSDEMQNEWNDVYTLDCAELPSGIYFLKVASNLFDETNMNIKTQTVSLIVTCQEILIHIRLT